MGIQFVLNVTHFLLCCVVAYSICVSYDGALLNRVLLMLGGSVQYSARTAYGIVLYREEKSRGL